MNLKSFNGSARRRGTTIAAAALSVAMVAPFVHPVVSPNAAPAAIAQDTTPDQKPSVDTRGTSEATAIRADGTWGQEQGYQGTVYLDRDSGPEAQNEADEAMSGVKVFLQYVNGKGQVSPIYYTTSDSEGKFVFDLSNAPKDGLGNPIEFKLSGDSKFQVRTWAENPDPAKYTLAAGGDMYSGRFHNRLTRKWESWDFTAGINRIVGAKIVFQERPNVDGWLAKPEAEWTEAPTVDKKWPESGLYGTARGSVWWENNEVMGSLPNQYFKGSTDRAATNVKVVGSYVNDEVARQFDAWKDANKNHTREQFRVAQKEIVDAYQAEHGEGSHIAESRVAYVKDDGSFYLPFAGLYGVSHNKKGNKTTDEEWGKLVSAEEEEHDNLMQWNGTLGQRHRHINTDYMYLYPVVGENRDLWMGNYQDNMFQPPHGGNLGIENASANISVQHFALLTPRPIHDVINYDNASAIAAPGDTAKSKTTGLVPNQQYAIEWFADGESTGEFCTVTANELGELESCDITVPKDLSKPTVYSSQVFAADASGKPTGTLLLADSFLADPTVVKYDETKGTAKEKDLEAKPSFDNPNTDAVEEMPEGATFEFADPAAAEKLGLTIDAKTGVITWPADKQVEGQNEALVKVTWTPAEGADPVSREVPAKFDLDAPAAKDNETFEPGYEDGSGKPGEDVKVDKPVFKDKDGKETKAPEGTKFTPGENVPDGVTIDENTGEITVTIPEDAKPGDKITVPVVVTYPDGSTDEKTVTVTVEEPDAPETPDAKDNESYEPEYNGGTGKPGDDVKIDKPEFKDKDNKVVDAPAGTKFTPGENVPDGVTIDENTGEITVKVPEDAKPGDKITVPVVVTYPDGSTDEVDVTVTVTEKDATPVTPVAPTENNPSTGASADDPASCEEPPYVTVEETEGVEYKVTVDGKELTPDADGKYVYDYGQTVKVEAFPTEGFTFPEGAQTTWTYTTQQNEVCDAPEDPGADKPDWKDDKGKPGDKVEIPNTGGPVEDGTTVETEGPGKAEIDENGNLIVDVDKDAKPGDKIVVVVKDKDGNEIDRVEVEVEQPDAPAEKPDWTDDKGKPGDKVEIPNTGGDVPDGTTVETDGPGKAEIDENGKLIVDIDEDAKPGDKVVVVVKDKDGNEIDRVEVEVEQPDAPAENPDWKDGKGKPGDKVEIPNTGGPVEDGTTVETEGPGKAEIDENGNLIVDVDKDAKPGDKIVVVVKDKDGNEIDRVEVEVEQPDAPAEKPDWKDGKGKPGDKVEIPNTGGPVEDGTTVETEGPGKAEIDENGKLIVDIDKDAKPGDKVVVVVKDKDGNEIDRVEVEVEQPDAPAENPDWKDGKGKPGDKVEIPNAGGPVEDGTTVETEGPGKAEIDENGKLIVDVDKDAKPGDKIVVVVKDKDGNEIDRVVVEVEKPDAPADKPDWKDDAGKPGDKVELPNAGGPVEDGTTVETEGPGKAEIDEDGKLIVDVDKDAKPGDKIVVVVKDKDGKEIDRVVVEVEKPKSPIIPGGPTWPIDPNKPGKDDPSETPEVIKPTIDPAKDGDKEITGTAKPGTDITVTVTDKDGKKTEKTVKVGDDGKWKVVVDKELKTGDKIVAKDKDGNEASRIVTGDSKPAPKPDGSADWTGSSNLSERCINTGLGIGIPLLFLIPVGLASQMNIPGLSEFVAPINKQIQDLNTRLQQQAGLFNGPLADQVNGINAQLKRFGADYQQAAGAVALIAAGALAIGLLADACAPGAGEGSSN